MIVRGKTKCSRSARVAEELSCDEGAAAVMVAIVLVVLIAAAAMAVDVGSLYAERRGLQTAADAGALAGVQELPNNTGGALDKARAYVAANAPESTVPEVWITSDLAPNDTIHVAVNRPDSPLFFARVWGLTTNPVAAEAIARITSPIAYGRGVMPFGVLATGTMDPLAAYGYSWGQLVRLKTEGGTGETGNFDLLSLGGPLGYNWGMSDLRSVIVAGGTSFPVYLNQVCSTSTGNKVPSCGALGDYLTGDYHTFAEVCPAPGPDGVVNVNDVDNGEPCKRLILCPIVIHNELPCSSPIHPYDWPTGRSTPVKIIGFAQFFVTEIGRTGNDAWIDGRFVRTVAVDEYAGAAYTESGQVHYSLVQ